MRGTDLLNQNTKIRREQASVVKYVINQDELVGQKMWGCGTWLHLREWLNHGGETRLINANFCKKFYLCKLCAIRRSLRFIDSYAQKVATIVAEQPGLIPAMVTLTVKNGPQLGERIEHLKGSWSRMIAASRKGESGGHRHGLVQWNHVAGSLRALEVKRGEDGWHPHLHVYTLLNSYLDQSELSREWLAWTGDSMVVDIRKCYGEPESALFEVIKYAVKFSDMSPEDLWHIHTVCAGGRGIDPTGCLRGVLTGDIDQDKLDGLDGPTVDYIARWLAMEQKYALEMVKPPTKYDDQSS